MKGSEIAKGLLPTISAEREAAILELVDAGHAIEWPWVPVESEHNGRTVTVFVRSDYFALGEPDDYIYLPVAYPTARAIASCWGYLPTPKIVDLIADQAEVKLEPRPRVERGAAMMSTRVALLHNETLKVQLVQAGAKFGELTVGQFKDLVMTTRLLEDDATARALFGENAEGPIIYGWRLHGKNIQPRPSTAHRNQKRYGDYSHGFRGVRVDGLVDGKPEMLETILADEELAPAISYANESEQHPSAALPAKIFVLAGPLEVKTDPPPAAIASTPASSEPRVLKRGMNGEDVADWQRVLNRDPKPDSWPAAWAFPLTVDGDFGKRTQAATESWQMRRGLKPDSVVGPKTRAAIATPPIVVAEERPIETPKSERPRATVIRPEHPAFELVDEFIRARHSHLQRLNPITGKPSQIDLVVLHSTETSPKAGGARRVARDFSKREDPASAHYVLDITETIQCVDEGHTAFAAPGANHNGIQIEQCGYAFKTDWCSGEGAMVVTRTVELVAAFLYVHELPARFVGERDLLEGGRGITLHETVTKACQIAQRDKLRDSPFFNRKENKPKTAHRDPGAAPPGNYPAEEVVDRVAMQLEQLKLGAKGP